MRSEDRRQAGCAAVASGAGLPRAEVGAGLPNSLTCNGCQRTVNAALGRPFVGVIVSAPSTGRLRRLRARPVRLTPGMGSCPASLREGHPLITCAASVPCTLIEVPRVFVRRRGVNVGPGCVSRASSSRLAGS